MTNRLKTSLVTVALAFVFVGVGGCSLNSTSAGGCADIKKAMTPFWDLSAEFSERRDAGDEETTPAQGVEFLDTMAQAAIDMRKISDRELGDMSKMANYIAIYLSDDNLNTPLGKDAGIAGLMMLRDICDLPPQ